MERGNFAMQTLNESKELVCRRPEIGGGDPTGVSIVKNAIHVCKNGKCCFLASLARFAMCSDHMFSLEISPFLRANGTEIGRVPPTACARRGSASQRVCLLR